MDSSKVSQFVVLVVLLLGVGPVPQASGRIFNKCSLARTLRQYGIPHHELVDWVCIAEHESSFNSKALNPYNSDGSRDWGLFQINDRYWCQPSDGRYSANICQISCDALLSNDIGRAVRCARIIKQQQGLSAWVAWNQRCQGTKPSVSKCFWG